MQHKRACHNFRSRRIVDLCGVKSSSSGSRKRRQNVFRISEVIGIGVNEDEHACHRTEWSVGVGADAAALVRIAGVSGKIPVAESQCATTTACERGGNEIVD